MSGNRESLESTVEVGATARDGNPQGAIHR
jgi:hypothetical protein